MLLQQFRVNSPIGERYLRESEWSIVFAFFLILGLDSNLFHRHPSSEDDRHGEVAAVAGVAGCHHVLRLEHLQEVGH